MFELSFGLVIIILCSASLLIQIFSLVTPYWVYDRDEDDEEHTTFLGLWQLCSTKERRSGDVHVCETPKNISDNMQWTRAMEIFGMLLIFAALLCGFLKHRVLKNQEDILKAGGACSFSAGSLMLVGIFCLVGEVTAEGQILYGLSFHASFGLCIVAALIAFVAGVLFFIWDRRDAVGTMNNSSGRSPQAPTSLAQNDTSVTMTKDSTGEIQIDTAVLVQKDSVS